MLRRLAHARGFAFTVIVTLGLGIGATVGVFSVVDAVLLRPLPYPHADRLVDLSHTLELSGITRVDQSDASFLHYRRANRTMAGVGAYLVTSVNLGALHRPGSADVGQPARVAAARISAGTFGVLESPPLAGRVFRDDEDRPGTPTVVVISERLWRRAYGADRSILGRQLEVDGIAREVIGIMPSGFRFPAADTEVWLPIGIDPAKTDSASFDYRAIGRLRDGVSTADAQADLQRLLLTLPEAFPGRLTLPAIRITKMQAVVTPLRDIVVGDVRRVLWIVLAAVGCILLVGCANVANLFLVRAEARQTELALRRALGAGRPTIVWQLLSEAVVLSAAGGALGVAIATAGLRTLRSLEATVNLPRLNEVGMDGTAMLVAAAATLFVALLVAGLPAVRLSAMDGSSLLIDGGRSATVGRRRQFVRRTLVVAQIALALVLVASAGLMARSFAHLRDVKPGFDARPVFTFRMALPTAGFPMRADIAQSLDHVVDAIEALPGVQAAGAITKLPLVDAGRIDTPLFVLDQPMAPGRMPNIHQLAYVSPEYFRAMSIPVVDGRIFDRMNPAKPKLEAVVSDALVRRYWPDGRAVGRQVRILPTGDALTIVGVVRSVRGTTLEEAPDEMIYLPLASSDPRWAPREFSIVVRSAAAPASVAPEVTNALRRLMPSVPLYAAQPMTDVMSGARARTSFLLVLLGIASTLAMALGAVGLFGISAYLVTLRGREMAIRLALGARPLDVRRMITRQGITLAVVGVVVGLGGAIAATHALAALLFGVSPGDPATLATAAALMIVISAAANWLPAHRAGRIDPAQALRAE